MKSLFAAILTISASLSDIPAIATASNEAKINRGLDINLSSKSGKQIAVIDNSIANPISSEFAQRSLQIVKQIPPDTIGLIVADIDRRSWQIPGQSSLNSISPIIAIDKLLDFFGGRSSKLSVAKDIYPWLGTEIAITFWITSTQKPELVFAALAPVADSKQFDLFVKKLKKVVPVKPTETLYKNVQIVEWRMTDETNEVKPESPPKSNASKVNQPLTKLEQAKLPNLNNENSKPKPKAEADQSEQVTPPSFTDFSLNQFAIAKLPSGLAVIGSDRQALEKMIDLSVLSSELKPPTLADNPLFLRSLNNPLWNRSVLSGYADYENLGKFAEILAADLPETSEIPGFSRAEYLQGMKYSLAQYVSSDLFTWITPKGIRSQSNSYFSSIRPPQPKDNETRDRLLSFLPANIYGAITSRNLNRQWQWFVEESKQQPSYKILVTGLRMVVPLIFGSSADIGIDIEKDIISWMDGEYAFVAFPSALSPLNELDKDLAMGMLIRTSKPEAANATLTKLTKYVTDRSQGFIQVKKRQVGVTMLTSFEVPDVRV